MTKGVHVSCSIFITFYPPWLHAGVKEQYQVAATIRETNPGPPDAGKNEAYPTQKLCPHEAKRSQQEIESQTQNGG